MDATASAASLAAAQAWHLERVELQSRIAHLESVLREYGINSPGTDPLLGASDGEHLEACKAVVRGAY
jgi:hypothetical protein